MDVFAGGGGLSSVITFATTQGESISNRLLWFVLFIILEIVFCTIGILAFCAETIYTFIYEKGGKKDECKKEK